MFDGPVGSIHLAQAQPQTIGRLAVAPWSPPGITLAELVCCVFAKGSYEDVTEDDQKWLRQPESNNRSFEGLVSRVREVQLESVAGAVAIRTGGRPLARQRSLCYGRHMNAVPEEAAKLLKQRLPIFFKAGRWKKCTGVVVPLSKFEGDAKLLYLAVWYLTSHGKDIKIIPAPAAAVPANTGRSDGQRPPLEPH
ncbi:MAG TPA: hypothetical protein VMQ76_13145 [Terracidiphilus sp.]|nr:hypothetical protein [Terracidiphilus sp.]